MIGAAYHRACARDTGFDSGAQPPLGGEAFPEDRARRRLPLLALHSSASLGGQWKALSQSLAWERDVLTPDLPGYGTASDSAILMHAANLETEARWLLAQAGAGERSFHLVGHSYGAAVALKLAMLAPQRIRSLTLIEPVLFHLLRQAGGSGARLERQILGVRDRVRGAVAAGWPAHGMGAFVDFWSGQGAWHRMDLPRRQILARQAKAVLRNFEAVLSEAWLLDDLAPLTFPIQVISGERSPDVTLQISELLTNAVGGVRATRIFGAGHMAPVTHTTAVNAAVIYHIERAENRRLWAAPEAPAGTLVA
ncbi:alpha/beta fold hydrolase [Pelagibius sp.]|uniref:alpha/beta fold hydrolase n=1 Tax=Pelagibius sp. TaxID=1931238 RepID=UPI00260C2E9F|nr:alpha/beta hydrolase [Pelagibius sp.]